MKRFHLRVELTIFGMASNYLATNIMVLNFYSPFNTTNNKQNEKVNSKNARPLFLTSELTGPSQRSGHRQAEAFSCSLKEKEKK